MSDLVLNVSSQYPTPAWGVFDADWYRKRYAKRIQRDFQESNPTGAAAPDSAWLKRHWYEKGAGSGLSPNPFFDEIWYLQTNDDVRDGVRRDGIFFSGFQHYCEVGYGSRAPHWLFSEKDYFQFYPDLNPHDLKSRGFQNGYDHYLRVGDQEQRSGHLFFDPALLREQALVRRVGYDFATGSFTQFLTNDQQSELRTSWYFDPQWYVERYPNVVRAIEDGHFSSALHHYLTNDTPGDYDPNPWFSEKYYRLHHPDVAGIVSNGGFRNGYEHFVRFGVLEHRNPCEQLNFAAFARQADVIDALRRRSIRDAFVLWVQQQAQPAVEPDTSPSAILPAQVRTLDLDRARALLPAMIRSPLVFGMSPAPSVSIVIAAQNDFHDLLLTLAALSGNDPEALEVIIVDAGSTDETTHISELVRGVTTLTVPANIPYHERWLRGVEKARRRRVVLLEAGVQPLPAMIRCTLASLDALPNSVIGPLVTGSDGHVCEAGSIIWRDGSITAYGEGLPVTMSDVAFRRSVDALTGGSIACDRIVLRRALEEQPALTDRVEIHTSLSLSLRRLGQKIVYDPSLVSRSSRRLSDRPGCFLSRAAVFRDVWGPVLHYQPFPHTPVTQARFHPVQPGILIVVESLPRISRGSLALRLHAVIRSFVSAGRQVTLFALNGDDGDRVLSAFEFPDVVETLCAREGFGLEQALSARAGYIDLIWLEGTRVLQRTAETLGALGGALPQPAIILSTASLNALEEYERAALSGHASTDVLHEATRGELKNAWICQTIVATSEQEAHVLRESGFRNVHTLGFADPILATSPADGLSFEDRKGLLFCLPVATPDDAVQDGLNWFIQNVIRKLDRILPGTATLALCGYRGERVNFSSYGRFARVEPLRAEVDLHQEMRRRRVLIAPSRVIGGQPAELYLAALHGLPSVVGENLAKQMGWADDEACLHTHWHDPEHFARLIARLYNEQDQWTKVSTRARERASQDAGGQVFDDALRSIVQSTARPSEADRHPVTMPNPQGRGLRLAPAPLLLDPKRVEASVPAPVDEAEQDDPPLTFLPRVGVAFS